MNKWFDLLLLFSINNKLTVAGNQPQAAERYTFFSRRMRDGEILSLERVINVNIYSFCLFLEYIHNNKYIGIA